MFSHRSVRLCAAFSSDRFKQFMTCRRLVVTPTHSRLFTNSGNREKKNCWKNVCVYSVKFSYYFFSFIQWLQSKILRSVTNAPWYVSNRTLHNDLHIPLVATEINRLSLIYHKRLVGHHNSLITAMATPPTIVRRLKRQCPTDLFQTAAGD